VIRADQPPHQVRDDQADEADHAGQRHRGAGGGRDGEEDQRPGAPDIDAERGGLLVDEG